MQLNNIFYEMYYVNNGDPLCPSNTLYFTKFVKRATGQLNAQLLHTQPCNFENSFCSGSSFSPWLNYWNWRLIFAV